ncbi:MAG: SYNERG-CTERM sorting domain-containing protein [Fretibacterium sp.]|nr:SYNERG-CTERM sorting domain-containing protein [Fretibacterium sp.]
MTSKLKRRSFALMTLLFALLFLAVPQMSDAHLLFTTQENYANTALGIIIGDKVTTPLRSNMGGNNGQTITPFINGDGQLRIAITLYTWGQGDILNLYAPGDPSLWTQPENWEPPLDESEISLQNTRDLTIVGKFLYGIDYDEAKVTCMEVKKAAGKETYEDTGLSYTYVPQTPGYEAHGEALFFYGGSLYGLFTEAYKPWEGGAYSLNRLIKLDGNLTKQDELELKGKNIESGTPGAYALVGKKLFVTSLGGVQSYAGALNPESQIEVVDLGTMETTPLVTAQDMNDKDPTFSHMLFAIAAANGKIYVQAVQWGTEKYNIRIYETTEEKLVQKDLTLLKEFTGVGWRAGLVHDPSTKALWAAVGSSLWRYDYNGKSWKEFDKDDLQGDISAFAVLATPEGHGGEPTQPGHKGDSGGGCDAGFGWLALLALLPAATLRRRS